MKSATHEGQLKWMKAISFASQWYEEEVVEDNFDFKKHVRVYVPPLTAQAVRLQRTKNKSEGEIVRRASKIERGRSSERGMERDRKDNQKEADKEKDGDGEEAGRSRFSLNIPKGSSGSTRLSPRRPLGYLLGAAKDVFTSQSHNEAKVPDDLQPVERKRSRKKVKSAKSSLTVKSAQSTFEVGRTDRVVRAPALHATHISPGRSAKERALLRLVA